MGIYFTSKGQIETDHVKNVTMTIPSQIIIFSGMLERSY